MTHREICLDLAIAKGTPFIEVPLEGVWYNRNYGKADVLTIRTSYTRFNLDIYECKVAKSDFNTDIKSGKYKRYFEYCHRLYFACPSGLVNKLEIPDNIGLIVRGKNGWTTIKQAIRNDIDIPYETLMSLLFYKGRIFAPNRDRLRYIYDIDSTDKIRLQGLGREIKKKVLDYNNLQKKYRELIYFMRNYFDFSDEETVLKFVNRELHKYIFK